MQRGNCSILLLLCLLFFFLLHAVLGQHGSPGSFGNGKVKRQAHAAGRLCSYVHVMYVYTSGRLWASRSGSPANDQHWWGGRLQSCTPPSFIHSFPLDPFCNENSLFSFISFSHTFLSWPTYDILSPCVWWEFLNAGDVACCALDLHVLHVWVNGKQAGKRAHLHKVYVKCQLGHVSLVSTRFQTLKEMTHVSNASTCLLNHPASNQIHMLFS